MKSLFKNNYPAKKLCFLLALITFIVACKKTEKESMYYRVMFESQGGTKVYSIPVDEGTLAKKPENPTKKNHAFNSWYLNDPSQPFIFETTPITASITLFAIWDKVANDVVFDARNGEVADTVTVAMGQLTTAPVEPVHPNGSIFKGWFTDAATGILYDFSTPVMADFKLYAGWGNLDLLQNGDFETPFVPMVNPPFADITAAYIPGWDKKHGVVIIKETEYNNEGLGPWPISDGVVEVEGTNHYFGITPGNWADQPAGDISLEQTIPVKPGVSYTVKCRTKVSRPDAGSEVQSFMKVSEKGKTGFLAKSTIQAGATIGTWYELKIDLTVPADCTEIVIKIGQTHPTRNPWDAFNERWAYFDDVKITQN